MKTNNKDATGITEGKKRMKMVNPSGDEEYGAAAEGSAEEEAGESKEEAKAEGDDEGVKVSPEFQSEIHELLQGATKQELRYASNCINECEDDMRKAEQEKESKNKGSKGQATPGGVLSTDGMPTD